MKDAGRPLRIAYISHISHLFGAGRSMLEAVAALDRTRVQPRLITIEPGPLEEAARAQGLRVDRLAWLRGPFWSNPLRLPLAVLRLARWLKREGIDIVELNRIRYDCLAVALAACRLAGCRFVQRSRMHADPLSWPRQWLLSRADLILGISAAASAPWSAGSQPRWWLEALSLKLRFVPSCRDVRGLRVLPADRRPVRALGVPDSARIMGMVAAMDPRKRPRLFLEAAARLAPRRPDLWFVLVGGAYGPRAASLTPYEQDLRGQAKRLGLAQRAVFTGYRDDAVQLLKNFDVLVLPSEREALGGVLVEAMALGVPVVASAVDGVPELVEDGANGLLVRGADPEDYARAAERVLAEPGLAERLRSAGLERAMDFDQDVVARKLEDIYARLARGEA